MGKKKAEDEEKQKKMKEEEEEKEEIIRREKNCIIGNKNKTCRHIAGIPVVSACARV